MEVEGIGNGDVDDLPLGVKRHDPALSQKIRRDPGEKAVLVLVGYLPLEGEPELLGKGREDDVLFGRQPLFQEELAEPQGGSFLLR